MMTSTDALTKPFAKWLENINNHFLKPQIYISEQSKKLLETFKPDNCLSYGHVVWITPVTILSNTINIGLATATVAVNACVAPIFLMTSACASDCDDVSECMLCEATVIYVEGGIVKDSIERIARSIIAPLDACISCEFSDG